MKNCRRMLAVMEALLSRWLTAGARIVLFVACVQGAVQGAEERVPGNGPSTFRGARPAPAPAKPSRAIEDPEIFAEHFSTATQRRLALATVRVDSPAGVGTGVVVGREGDDAVILTAWHCVAKGGPITIQTFDYRAGTSQALAGAIVAGHHDQTDLALLRIKTNQLTVAMPICPKDRVPQPRFPAMTAGCDGGAPNFREGEVIANVGLPSLEGRFWEFSGGSQPGRSGGAVIDAQGQVVGICCRGDEGRGYYADAESIRALMIDCGYEHLMETPRQNTPTFTEFVQLAGRLMVWFLVAGFLLRHQPSISVGDIKTLTPLLFLQIGLLICLCVGLFGAAGMSLVYVAVIAIGQLVLFGLVGRSHGLAWNAPYRFLPALVSAIALPFNHAVSAGVFVATAANLHLVGHVFWNSKS